MKIISLLTLLVAFTGCRSITFTNFDTAETLHGKAHSFLVRTVFVTMPDGEVLKGHFSAINNSSVGFAFGSATAFSGGQTATAFGSGTSYNIGGSGVVYALMQSTKPGSKLMMEFKASFSPMSGHGFGEARTNDGRTYRLMF